MDWTAVKARLESIARSQVQTDSIGSQHARAVLEARARRAAVRDQTDDRPDGANMLLVFRLGAERYAVRAASVREVVNEPKLAKVPGAPDTVAGLMQLRGQVLPVLRLDRLLVASTDLHQHEAPVVIIVRRPSGNLTGLSVTAIEEVRDSGGSAGQLTNDLVTILDLDTTLGKEH